MTQQPIPSLDNVADIVVGDLPCDGVPGAVLAVVAVLRQGPLFVSNLRKQLASKFKNDVGKSFDDFGSDVNQQVGDQYDQQFGAGGFERWNAQFSQDGYMQRSFNPLAPSTAVQPINQDEFGLFGTESIDSGSIVPDSGSGADVNANGCDAALSTTMDTAVTGRLKDQVVPFETTLDSVGKVLGFASILATSPSHLMDAPAATINDVLGGLLKIQTIVKTLPNSVDGIVAQLKTLREEDYAVSQDLFTFQNLLGTAKAAVSDAETAIQQGTAPGQLGPLDDDAIAKTRQAAAWIKMSNGASSFYGVSSAVLGLLLLLDTQSGLLGELVPKTQTQTTNILGSHGSLSNNRSNPGASFANIYTTARCQLSAIQNELLALNQQKTQSFFLKRLQWFSQLQATAALMENFAKTSFDTKLTTALNSDVGKELQALGETAGLAGVSHTLGMDNDELGAAIENFIKQAKAKLKNNLEVKIIESAATRVKLAVTNLLKQSAALIAAFQPVSQKPTMTAAASRSMELRTAIMAVPSLITLGRSLAEVNYSDLFSKDALNDSLNRTLAKLLDKALTCCGESGVVDAVSRDGMDQLRTLGRSASDDERRDYFDMASFTAVSQSASTAASLNLRGVKQQIRNLVNLMKIPCLGGVSVPQIL